MIRNLKLLLSFLFLSLATAPRLDAANVLVSWTANTEPDLAGYKVYYRTGSATYGTPINVGKVSSHTLTGLSSGTYFFALKAYDTSQNESAFSTEVSLVVPVAPPTPGGPAITITGPANRQLTLTRRAGNMSTKLPLTVNKDDCVKYNGVKLAGGANCP